MVERILLVDDEPSLVASVAWALDHAGFEVHTAGDAVGALAAVRDGRPNLVLLDVMLPGIDGFELCRQLRTTLTAPIVMLTARDDPVDRVVGLEVGADDYITKPFSVRELIARVKAHLRRESMPRQFSTTPAKLDGLAEDRLVVGCLEVDVARRRAVLDGRPLALKRRELDLLVYMARNSGIVLSRSRLLSEVWEDELSFDTRTVDVHVRRLRRHIESEGAQATYLHTVRGVGYVLRHEAHRPAAKGLPRVNRR